VYTTSSNPSGANNEYQNERDNRLDIELLERIKEFNCFYYSIAKKVEGQEGPLKNILQEITELLPLARQYPDKACGHVVHGT